MESAGHEAERTRVYDAQPREIAALGEEELVARYRHGVENFDARIFQLSDGQLDTAFLPDAGVGRWPVRVLLGHLADAELVLTHRMRRAFAEESPVLAVWDEGAFVDAGLYHGPAHPIGAMVAVVHTLRRWTARWYEGLGEEQRQRRAMHPERGPQTVRAILVSTTGHLEHHAAYLNAKVERMLGPASGAGGGCGPGCGCKPG